MKLNRIVKVADHIVYSLNRFFVRVAMVILFVLMFLTFFDVIGRYFFVPITGAFELTELGLALLVFFSLGYTQMNKEHIQIGVIVNRWPPKTQAIANMIIAIITFVVLGLLTWRLLAYAVRSQSSHTLTGDLDLPMFIFIILSAVGGILFSFTMLIDFLKSLQEAVGSNES